MEYYYFSRAIFRILQLIKRSNWEGNLIRKFPLLFFNPHMRRNEYVLFKDLCKNKKVFLEYGSGGSTIHLLKNNKSVFSVESNPDYYQYMCSLKYIRRNQNLNLHYLFINLGPTNEWGEPLSKEYIDEWPRYYEQIWQQIDPALHKVDLVLIDGRFRICCCLYSILKAIEYNWLDMVFVFHDFWRRDLYHVVLNFLQESISAENLVSFRMKNSIDVNELKDGLVKYALVTK